MESTVTAQPAPAASPRRRWLTARLAAVAAMGVVLLTVSAAPAAATAQAQTPTSQTAAVATIADTHPTGAADNMRQDTSTVSTKCIGQVSAGRMLLCTRPLCMNYCFLMYEASGRCVNDVCQCYYPAPDRTWWAPARNLI